MKYETPLQNKLMLQNKVYYINGKPNNPYKDIIGEDGYKLIHDYDTAFHIDAYKTGEYLRDYCLKTGRVKRIEDTVKDVTKNELGGIKSLKLETGYEIEADLFLDCSGFSKVLMKHMDTKFISYKDNLLTNKALLFPKKHKEKDILKSLTTATARKYGWTFEIPLQERMGRGYVFNGDMISEEQAADEMREAFNEDIEFKKVIDFEPGRLDKFWNKNVIAIGLSSHFVEPLEATAIHATISQASKFLEYYFTSYLDVYDKDMQNDYNEHMTSFIDDIRDFIIFHYITPRNDTNFWKEASSKDRWTEQLTRKMNIWKKRMPRQLDYHHKGRTYDIGNALWLQVGLGMEIFDSEIAKKELNYYRIYNKAKEDLKGIERFATYMCDNAMETNKYYDMIAYKEISELL